jgi:hypothetical protein
MGRERWHTQRVLRRIERDAGVPNLTAILTRLAPADLRSLVLHVLSAHAEGRTPASLLAQYERDGSVKPEPCDGRVMHALDGLALNAAAGFESVELSPVGPLGTNAVLGQISQNNVLSTIRNTEVIADPTAALALECALRRRASDEPVRLCAVGRTLRLQPFDMPGYTPHFRLFALVSAGRGGTFVADEIAAHLRVYSTLLDALREYGSDHQDVALELSGVRLDLPGTTFDPDRQEGLNYYDGPMLRVSITDREGIRYPIADGGTVPWTQRLLSNAKERLVISGFGLGLIPARFL